MDKKLIIENFIKKTSEFNVMLDEKQVETFVKYQDFLEEFNAHTNLVSCAEAEIVFRKHFLDSLAFGLIKDYVDINSEKTLIDIGIGGGFPGIPIVLAFPEIKLCATDSIKKKTDFLLQLSENLEIQNRVEVLNTRAEEAINLSGKRQNFDIATARAVSKLNVLLEYSLPFLKVGGYFVAYKAKTSDEEIKEAQNALKILGGKVVAKINYSLSDEERNLILIEKIAPTPEKYPRKTGTPLKNPI